MELTITVREKAGNVFVVSPAGSLDTDTYLMFERKISEVLDQSPAMLVLDLKRLDYLSSAGIRSILKTRNQLKSDGGKITFMNLQPQIQKVFDIIQAIPSMRVFSSMVELDAYLDTMQKKVKAGKPQDEID